MAAGVTYLAFESKRLSEKWRRRLTGLPVVGKALASVIAAPTELMRSSTVFEATTLQLGEIFLDAATLDVSLRAVGFSAPLVVVLASYVIADVGSRVAFVPLGIGTFEAACVTLLHAGGVPFGPALAATLLFRGFTLWLPMVPGLFSARRALDAAR
jgi:uncharacterized membrane protein YbhN (UPF0104 family)